jgi:SAM-dependent methyltransferase
VQPAVLSAADAERLRAFERQGHDRLALTYHAFFSPVSALATQPLLDAVMASSSVRLLDVACGPGALAAAAKMRGALAVGVDLSTRILDLARQSRPGIDFREADVEHLPFADGCFDAVACSFALGHLPYPELALAECVRVLNAGGRIALGWWDHPDRQRIQGVFREAITEVGASPPPELPQGHTIGPDRPPSPAPAAPPRRCSPSVPHQSCVFVIVRSVYHNGTAHAPSR